MVLIIGIIISFGVSGFSFRPWFPHFRFSVSAKNFHFGASLTVTLLEFKLKPVKCKNKLAIRVYKTKWKDLFTRLALSLQRQFQEELWHRHQRHSEHTIQYGFTSVMECYEEKPKCLLCSKVLSAESMKPNKLKRHFEPPHKEHVGKPRAFFENKLANRTNSKCRPISKRL